MVLALVASLWLRFHLPGPVLQCQLLETPLLTLTNFPSLIATKSARMNEATGGSAILDFGLRRAQGIDGGITASRAAYIGGCSSTSNVLAGKLLGIPVKGTHAHSWIMFFDSEKEAFEKFAYAHPNNAVFLVDTYDSLKGVQKAIEVGKKLRERGHEMVGVRLDSGDMAELSKKSRKLLDEAGFEDAKVIASSEIDEYIIKKYRERGAQINIYGVGTKLVTGEDDPALGGVYKLAARKLDGEWDYRLKLSEEDIKINNPGLQQVRRYKHEGRYLADMIYDVELGISGQQPGIHSLTGENEIRPHEKAEHKDLLEPVYRHGKRVYELPPLVEIQKKAKRELSFLPERVRELKSPQQYFAGLESALYKKKQELINAAIQRTVS